MAVSTAFTGFGRELPGLYEGLAADNSRDYWQRHREVYESAVAGPMQALAAELEPEFGDAKVFRPYRDLRFTPDKRPLQEHASAGFGMRAGVGYYLQVDATHLLLAAGMWDPTPTQLRRFRELQDDGRVTRGLDAVVERMSSADIDLGDGDPVKTAPRGWSAEHPRIHLLRRRRLTAMRRLRLPSWLYGPAAVDRISEVYAAMRPWNAWLADHLPANRPDDLRRPST